MKNNPWLENPDKAPLEKIQDQPELFYRNIQRTNLSCHQVRGGTALGGWATHSMSNETPQLTVKRIEFWIALMALVGTLTASIFGLTEQHKQNQTLTNIEEMTRQAIMRPCEGKWKYTIRYSRFHSNTNDTFVGYGGAVMTWQPDHDKYDVIVWTSVTRDGFPNDELVTAVAEGGLQADKIGRPPDNAAMPLTYLARTGKPPYEQSSAAQTDYTNLKFKWAGDGSQIETITAKFHTSRSDGMVTFQRE